MRDYSEKRGSREREKESIERKPVAKNRPRKESGGLLMVLSVMALVCLSFGAGVFAGWKLKGARTAASLAIAQPAKKEEPAAAPVQPKPDAPLTFYKTLPAGGRGVIGTGLNLKKPEPAPSAVPVVAPATAPGPEPGAVPAAVPAAPVAAPAPASAPAKPESTARFVVQVASYHEKHEAVEAQAKLAGKGVAAYLVESKVPDKGVWYRLRVGKHLTKGEAAELAGKSGKGAIVLPE